MAVLSCGQARIDAFVYATDIQCAVQLNGNTEREKGGRLVLRNVAVHLRNCTASQPNVQLSSRTVRMWEGPDVLV